MSAPIRARNIIPRRYLDQEPVSGLARQNIAHTVYNLLKIGAISLGIRSMICWLCFEHVDLDRCRCGLKAGPYPSPGKAYKFTVSVSSKLIRQRIRKRIEEASSNHNLKCDAQQLKAAARPSGGKAFMSVDVWSGIVCNCPHSNYLPVICKTPRVIAHALRPVCSPSSWTVASIRSRFGVQSSKSASHSLMQA